MNREPDDDQYQLNDYHRVEENETTSRCRVCGFESSDSASVENCHPATRLDRERITAVTDPQNEHTGFVIPPYMDVTAQDLIEDVRTATDHVRPEAVLPAATDVLVEHFPASMSNPTAFQVFTHLVWLQQYQVLPGYPIRTDPETTARVPIQEFCNDAAAFEGTVTTAQIRDAAQLNQGRIYRAKVLFVTDSFFKTSPVADAGILNAADTGSRWDELRFPASALFAARTPHNTVVRETRNWLVTHPDIDWAVAPHMMGVPQQTTSDTQSPSEAPSSGTVSMFDFAGFTGHPQSEVAVIGCVFGGEEYSTLFTKLEQIRGTTATALLVVRSREEIHQVIDKLDANEWPDSAAAPIDETCEYYARQPSIQAVNEEFTARVPELDYIRFITGKQLIDDIITPVDVFPDRFPHQVRSDQ